MLTNLMCCDLSKYILYFIIKLITDINVIKYLIIQENKCLLFIIFNKKKQFFIKND